MSKPLDVPNEQPQSSTDISSQSMNGYEALQKLWTQPPQPLPGPDDHPFFKMFAPNAYGSLLQLGDTAAAPKTHVTVDERTNPKESAFEMPMVYPFLPAPSISMEPMTPESDCARIVKISDTISNEKKEETTPPASTTATYQRPALETLDKTEVEAICVLTYMRAIPNSETREPAVIANGQIWRSPDKKKGWRRNQWVVDVR